MRRKLQRPGARHADHPGLGRRIGRARRRAQGGAGGVEHHPAKTAFLHGGQKGLQQRQGRAEVQLGKASDVLGLGVFDEIGPDQPGVMHQMGHVITRGDVGGHGSDGGGIEQVGFDMLNALGLPFRLAARDGNHPIAALQQTLRQICTDALAAPGDDGGVTGHGLSPGISASTRNGLPVPPLILSGGAISMAPVGGSWSRLHRHCSPYLPAPCSR